MLPVKSNIIADLPDALQEEIFTEILSSDAVKIERIVSRGQVTPEDQWYDQDDNEWIMVLRGAAHLQFADGEEVALETGDHLDIPAHCRHRVSWTDPAQRTIWLAVFYRSPNK